MARGMVGVLFGAALLLLGTAAAGAEETYKIGFNAPLTGFAAADGNSARLGAELAIEQVNAAGGAGGRLLELVVIDDQADPKQAVPGATKLVEAEGVIMGISGSYSGATRASAGVYQGAERPYISAYAVHPDITRTGDYVFRTSFVGEVQGRAGAKLLGEDLGAKKVVLITLNNDFGKSLAAGFKEKARGLSASTITRRVRLRHQGSPSSAQSSRKVKADEPDAIYASGYFFTAGPLVSAVAKVPGVDAPVSLARKVTTAEKFIEIAGAGSRGCADHHLAGPRLRGRRIDPRLHRGVREARPATPRTWWRASAHTAVLVMAEALKQAGARGQGKAARCHRRIPICRRIHRSPSPSTSLGEVKQGRAGPGGDVTAVGTTIRDDLRLGSAGTTRQVSRVHLNRVPRRSADASNALTSSCYVQGCGPGRDLRPDRPWSYARLRTAAHSYTSRTPALFTLGGYIGVLVTNTSWQPSR